jgi:hypothetical protein
MLSWMSSTHRQNLWSTGVTVHMAISINLRSWLAQSLQITRPIRTGWWSMLETRSRYSTHWLAHSPPHWLTHSPPHCFAHCFAHWLTHWLTHCFPHWLTHSPPDWLTHWLTHCFTHWLTHSPPDWLTHWLTHLWCFSAHRFVAGCQSRKCMCASGWLTRANL